MTVRRHSYAVPAKVLGVDRKEKTRSDVKVVAVELGEVFFLSMAE